MSMLQHLLFCYFSSVRILFPTVPMALLLCAELNRAFVLLPVAVTCFLSLSLALPLPLSLAHPTSSIFSSPADN